MPKKHQGSPESKTHISGDRQVNACMYIHSVCACMYSSSLARYDVNRSVTQALLHPKETTDKPNKDTVQNAWLVFHNLGSTLKPRKV